MTQEEFDNFDWEEFKRTDRCYLRNLYPHLQYVKGVGNSLNLGVAMNACNVLVEDIYRDILAKVELTTEQTVAINDVIRRFIIDLED